MRKRTHWRANLAFARLKSLFTREELLHRLFQIGIFAKAADGVLETIGGILFLTVSRFWLSRIVITLTQGELSEDPDDLVANWLRHVFGHLSESQRLFGGFYLAAHGLIKVFLVVGLWRCKLWSFPVAIVFLAGFIAYQVYRVSLQFSWGLVTLSLFDAAVALLIAHEYKRLKRGRHAKSKVGWQQCAGKTL